MATIIEDHPADAVALIDGSTPDVAGTRITYGELRERVGSLRSRLARDGVGPNARVAILAGNEAGFVVGALATLGLGGLAVPILPTNPLPELQRKLAAVAPSVVLVGQAGAWVFDQPESIDAPLIELDGVDESGSAPPPITERDGNDVAVLMPTSGVTATPKVAMLSHRNLAWVQEILTADTDGGLAADDVILGVLPFVHIFGLNVALLPALRVGATVVLQRRFDPLDSLRLIRDHGITVVAGAPPMWQQWAEADRPDDPVTGTNPLATIRLAGSGAAALPVEVFTAIKDRYGVEITEGYGLTETSPAVTYSRGIPVRPGSVGKPIPGLEVALVEPDGTPVDRGDSGEIVIRGPGVFMGYLDAPDLTAQVLTDDGWFWTGDMGVFDDDGYLYIVDRIKDVIIVSGFNVYPAEVESALMEHADVRGAVVVGTAHGETGETVVAHVSGDVDVAELDSFARKRLSRYKCPTEYHIVDQLPVAPTGKPVRRELRRGSRPDERVQGSSSHEPE